jgi:hypothetical protein
MQAKISQLETRRSSPSLPPVNPWVIGVGSFGVGFVIGSGCWQSFAKEMIEIASSMGSFIIQSAVKSAKEQNRKYFL